MTWNRVLARMTRSTAYACPRCGSPLVHHDGAEWGIGHFEPDWWTCSGECHGFTEQAGRTSSTRSETQRGASLSLLRKCG